VATYFGGTRRIRVNYSEKIGDIIHDTFSIEVKYGKQVPVWCVVQRPTIVKKNNYTIYLEPSDFDGLPLYEEKKVRGVQFLLDAFEQAKNYDPSKPALVCVKRRGQRGFTICRLQEYITKAYLEL
jgi:hypothetical protein